MGWRTNTGPGSVRTSSMTYSTVRPPLARISKRTDWPGWTTTLLEEGLTISNGAEPPEPPEQAKVGRMTAQSAAKNAARPRRRMHGIIDSSLVRECVREAECLPDQYEDAPRRPIVA